jgi:class 3 adenylate cyclase/tetratricopeptide (TPR) repeat protein
MQQTPATVPHPAEIEAGEHHGTTSPSEGYPKESIKKMAVLFTDIVGSTKFFKAYGDVAGRKMLKDHEEIASPPILEHGGVVVKMLGDSLMAFFFHPSEAVKSAIKIQQRFQARNRGKGAADQIHIRIGVHFGEGILDEGDIFGDVVNMAAKFLPLVPGDTVGISQEVHDQIQGLSQLHFQRVDLGEGDIFPESFHLYSVHWDEDINLTPLMKMLVYFRPLFGLGKGSFRKIWDKAIRERNTILSGCVEKEAISSDRSYAVIVKEHSLSLAITRKFAEYIRVTLGLDASLYLPVQVIIDVGPFLRGDMIELDALDIRWEDIEPGNIYLSAPVFHILKSRCSLEGVTPCQGSHPQPLYRIPLGNEDPKEDFLFLYQHALVQGDLSPCFYCGDRRHSAAHCPSKKLTEMSSAAAKMGYLPLEKINRLFFNYLNGTPVNPDAELGDGTDSNNPAHWPAYCFYELKAAYQLRLFRALWNTREDDWGKIREKTDGRNQGGLVWIALDCIRVGNLEQAESILRDSLAKEPDDYRPLCAMAFLHIEKNDFTQAKFYLKKALDRGQTAPQKIFALFLLSRLYLLQEDQARAEEMNRRILRLHPNCSEAVYEDALFQFRKGKEAIGLHQLIKLVKKSREYYVHALIDPELTKFKEVIHPKLKALLDEARDQAGKLVRSAKEELDGLRRWLGTDEKETKDAEGLLSKMDELSKVDSYFAYLDIIHYGTNLVGMGRATLEERRKRVGRVLRELAERYERDFRFVRDYPYRFLVTSLAVQLKQIEGRINRNWGMDDPGSTNRFKSVLDATGRLSDELDEIESRLKRLEALGKVLFFLSRFLKKTLIFQSVNLLVAIILFPIVMYYLNFILPGLSITPQNIWSYQKAMLYLGAVSGLLLALVPSGRNPPEDTIHTEVHPRHPSG